MRHLLVLMLTVLVALVMPLATVGCAALGPVVPGVAAGVWAGWPLRGIVEDKRPDLAGPGRAVYPPCSEITSASRRRNAADGRSADG